MAGGLMQLVAYGTQDMYITGNPQVTFFKAVFRRYTNFSIESIKQNFSGNVDFGRRITCTISRNGDLIHRLLVEIKLPTLQKITGETNNIYGQGWVDEIGHAIIKSVELEIGGQLVDKHYGHWLEVHSQLTEEVHPGHHLAEDTDSTATLIGEGTASSNLNNYQKMAYAGGISFNIKTVGAATASDQIMYVPLRFWFNRHVGLSLPLIALQYHEVNINVVFSACYSSVANKTELWCNYIYLDTDERRRFAQVSHEYLIEQLQYNQFNVANGNNSLKLNLNHPVKELIWGSRLTAHKVWGNTSTAGYFSSIYDSSSTVELKLNGHDRFEKQHIDYFTRYQPYKHHNSAGGYNHNNNDTIAVYSFALKPNEHQPSGTCNFSRIDNSQLIFNNLKENPSGEGKIYHLYAINYNVLRIMSGMGGLAYSN